MTIDRLIRQPSGKTRELGSEHHSDADGCSVPPLIALSVLDSVTESVPVVEDLSQPRLAEVLTDNTCLDTDRQLDDPTELLTCRISDAIDIVFDEVENLGLGDEAALRNFSESRKNVVAWQRLECVEVGDDRARCIERADEVFFPRPC